MLVQPRNFIMYNATNLSLRLLLMKTQMRLLLFIPTVTPAETYGNVVAQEGSGKEDTEDHGNHFSHLIEYHEGRPKEPSLA